MDERLKIYELLYKAYADEIKNLWQRSIFLGAFMVLVWTGYGALQLKFITRECGKFDTNVYYFASLGLCAVIIVLSLLWIAMAKGSKFVQEAHEDKIKNFDFLYLEIDNMFCRLDSYEYPLQKSKNNDTKNTTMNPNLNPNFFFIGALRAYRYSPSKINIALGWLSIFIAVILVIIHIYKAVSISPVIAGIFGVFLAILCPLSTFISTQIKGGKSQEQETICQAFINLYECIKATTKNLRTSDKETQEIENKEQQTKTKKNKSCESTKKAKKFNIRSKKWLKNTHQRQGTSLRL